MYLLSLSHTTPGFFSTALPRHSTAITTLS
jgi:hypothetical protein